MTQTSKTVATLREALANLPDDLPVLVSEDPEGNGFNHLWDVEVSKYYVVGGEIQTVHPDDVAEYEEDDEPLLDAVVLWP